MTERTEKVIKALERNNISGFYVDTRNQAVEKVRSLLFDGCTITAGGSVSLKESGVWDLINSERYNFIDRSAPGITEEQRLNAYKAAIGCDFFFCSSNAVTENGELINVDGHANRISSICAGPKNVIMIVGINKFVKDIDEGFLRIKRIAAPKNCVRLGIDNPCAKIGHCISLEKSSNPGMTDGCSAPRRICCDYLVSAHQQVKGRIKVIICGEELGY